jgi:hypothetical protein
MGADAICARVFLVLKIGALGNCGSLKTQTDMLPICGNVPGDALLGRKIGEIEIFAKDDTGR